MFYLLVTQSTFVVYSIILIGCLVFHRELIKTSIIFVSDTASYKLSNVVNNTNLWNYLQFNIIRSFNRR